ncbi:hypothetical protein MMC09_002105 [Bachmanniomyces sp. S44760]|nr:hypothetical protein [Bachmanniomyces sp. S44760]
MSSAGGADVARSSSIGTTKGKNKKKKKSGVKAKPNGNPVKTNGISHDEEAEIDDVENEESPTPVEHAHPKDIKEDTQIEQPVLKSNGSTDLSADVEDGSAGPSSIEGDPGNETESKSPSNGTKDPRSSDPEQRDETSTSTSSDTSARLEAMSKERSALRDEVIQLRKSLEDIQEKHEEEIGGLREQLDDTQGEKEHAETQYRNLLGKVNTIKSQLGERLKADAEDLAQARSHIEGLEEQNGRLQSQTEIRATELARLAEEGEHRSKELSLLRNRTNLSQQNWLKEKEDLVRKEAFAREEFEAARQAMQDWEVLAMEERSIREGVSEKVSDLEEQISNYREAYEKAASQRDSQGVTVDGLQRALQDIQEARKRELREIVENSQAQVEALRKDLQASEKSAKEASSALESTREDLESALPFEKEVKEKNLLIGKLRHEAVILNDHLTKALRYLKKGKPEDSIDKQLITNHFLHFLALDRADAKKYQILQIVAALLGWSDEEREQAGLARPGASNPNLAVPKSPWHRTPSTPALSSSEFGLDSGSRKESLAELWSDFLEQEAKDGTKTSRSTSISSSAKPTEQ